MLLKILKPKLICFTPTKDHGKPSNRNIHFAR